MSEAKRPITADDLNRIITIESPRISPDGRHAAFVKVTADAMERGYKRNIWLHDMQTGANTQLTRGDKDSQPAWSPDGKNLAFVSARGDEAQIFLLPLHGVGGEARQLTSKGNGAHSPAWSPDSGRIAFLAPSREDEREAEDRGDEPPQPNDKLEGRHQKERRAEDEKQRWDPRPMWRIPYRQGVSFVDERYDQVHIVDVAEDAKPRRLTNLNADYAPPQFSADGSAVFSARATMPEADEPWRAQNVFRIDAGSGEETALTDGAESLYGALPSPDGEWIAVGMLPIDMTDMPMRLLVMSLDGADKRVVNEALDREALSWRWSEDGTLAFTVESEGATTPWLYDPESDSIQQLHNGLYDIEDFDIGSGALAMSVSTPQNPQELYTLRDAQLAEATDFNHAWLGEVIVQEVCELRFTSPNGPVQGWHLLPVDHQPGDKAPLALNIHGGPHATWGYATRTMWHEWQFHAARGYAVFYCNPRGSGGYGESFMRQLHAAWGPVAMDDIMAGVDALLALGFVDDERMAITGGSYGGYMTAWIIGHTGRFKAAVAQRGVYNLTSFYGTSDVPLLISSEFDVEPWQNHSAYWDNSPLKYAADITTPLLLIHSENDFRVPIEQGEQLFAWVRRATDTPVRMLRYPREGHELSRSGEPTHRVSRLTEMVDWFDEYAKG